MNAKEIQVSSAHSRLKKKGWYAIYTAPRAEKKVRDRLAAKIPNDPNVINTSNVFLPTTRVKKIWSDRVKVVEQVLFPSYVFVYCFEDFLRELLMVEGVVRIVYYNGSPAIIPDKEIQEIRRFVDLAGECEPAVGEQVQILTGGLKLLTGKIQRIGKSHLYLCLDKIGISVCVRKENVKKT